MRAKHNSYKNRYKSNAINANHLKKQITVKKKILYEY